MSVSGKQIPKKRTFDEFISGSLCIESRDDMVEFFEDIERFIFQISPTRRTVSVSSRDQLSKKSLSDWLKANSEMIGQMLSSEIADGSVFKSASTTVSFMLELKILKDGLLLTWLSKAVHQTFFSDVSNMLLDVVQYLSNEEAEDIFKTMREWKGRPDVFVPLLKTYVIKCSKYGFKFASKEKMIPVVQKWVKGCYRPSESDWWINSLEEIAELLQAKSVDDFLSESVEQYINVKNNIIVTTKVVTIAMKVRGEYSGLERELLFLKKVVEVLETSDKDESVIVPTLELLKVYIENTHINLNAAILVQICTIMSDVLDKTDMLFKFLNESVVKEKKSPPQEISTSLMTFLEGHISSIDSQNGMICLQRVIVHYNSTITKTIVFSDEKIEVVDKTGNGKVHGIHLLWEVAIANKNLYLPIVDYMAKFFCNVPMTICPFVVDTFTSLCTSTDTVYLVKTLILFIEKTKELIKDSTGKNTVDVYLEEDNDNPLNCTEFKSSLQSVNSKPDDSIKEIIKNSNTFLDNFVLSKRIVFLRTFNCEDLGRLRLLVTKKLKSLVTENKAKIPKAFEFVQSVDEEELIGRVYFYNKENILTDEKNSNLGKEVTIKFGEYTPVIYQEHRDEMVKKIRCTNKKLVEKLISIIQSNTQVVAYSCWLLLEVLFDFISELTDLNSALSEITTKPTDASILPALAFVVKSLTTENKNSLAILEDNFASILNLTSSLIKQSQHEKTTIGGVIIEQLSHIVWHVFCRVKNLRSSMDFENVLSDEFLTYIDSELQRYSKTNEAMEMTRKYTTLMYMSFLFSGMIYNNNNCFYERFVYYLKEKDKPNDLNELLKLIWWYDDERSKKYIIKFYEMFFNNNLETSGYYCVLKEIVPRYLSLNGESQVLNTLCENILNRLLNYIETNNKNVKNVQGLVELIQLANLIVQSCPRYAQTLNLGFSYLPFLNAFLFPLVIDDFSDQFPRCKSQEMRKAGFDFVMEITNDDFRLKLLLSHLCKFFSFHTRQKLQFSPPLIKGKPKLVEVIYQFSSFFSSQFLTQRFKIPERSQINNPKIENVLDEVQKVVLKLQSTPDEICTTESLERLLSDDFSESCEDTVHILHTFFDILKNSESSEFSGAISILKHSENNFSISQEIAKQTAHLVFLSLEEDDIEEAVSLTKITPVESNFEYYLYGTIGSDSSQFQIDGTWFYYGNNRIDRVESVCVKKRSSAVFVYRKIKIEKDPTKKVKFSFKNEVMMFEQAFQNFVYGITVKAEALVPYETLQFVFFYFDVVYLRLPRLPLASKWNVTFHELYDMTQNDEWVLTRFNDVQLLDTYSRCRSPEIRAAVYDLLHTIIEKNFNDDVEKNKRLKIEEFIKTCLLCIESSPSFLVVELFDFYAVNSFKEMNYVVAELNCFERILKIVKSKNGTFLPNNCAASLLRTFYTLYVNCEFGEIKDGNKRVSKQLVHLDNDRFMDDTEFLYAITKFEVTNLFLEEFMRVTFLGNVERTTNFLLKFFQNLEEVSMPQIVFLKNLFKINERMSNEMAKALNKSLKVSLQKITCLQEAVNIANEIIILSELSSSVVAAFKNSTKQINDALNVYALKIVFV
ncbi:hypothetical protein EIN_055230 [Entamoeba invadens IP1]|uniref:hypothetical protein n=1 Tax=Entamoeba invadens IP1 TaxID=370355 RepID=UPI0002C3F139|nr:hypothetical protein EIN_055230 [Entamoeba invadens IP1]ELP93218.1 hypothetical protein EIN_055230 [Entamoeba invadens IP1]|eukprot:XP_004259989.1 hypothetical protein EIN_055230 [Entamoeba invadens IP1]